MDIDSQKLHLKFDIPDLESGQIDAEDFVHTVAATADLLKFVSKDLKEAKNKDLRIDVGVPSAGSFEIDIVVTLKDITNIAPAFVPLLSQINVISTAKQIIDILKTLIRVKKFLKGEKPSKIEVVQNEGSPQIAIHNNSGHINVNVNTFNVLQNENANKKLQKIVQPLLKEGAEVKTIEVGDTQDNPIQITKEEALYFEKGEELQTTPHRVKGIITALDRKTTNGKISIGDRRVNFEIEIEDIKKLDKIIDGLIESMKYKLAIIAIGEAVFDYESNLRKLKIRDIEKEGELFEERNKK